MKTFDEFPGPMERAEMEKEYEEMLPGLFKDLDKNGDNKLSLEEFTASMGPPGPPPPMPPPAGPAPKDYLTGLAGCGCWGNTKGDETLCQGSWVTLKECMSFPDNCFWSDFKGTDTQCFDDVAVHYGFEPAKFKA